MEQIAQRLPEHLLFQANKTGYEDFILAYAYVSALERGSEKVEAEDVVPR